MPWLNAMLTYAPETVLDLLLAMGKNHQTSAAMDLIGQLAPEDQGRLVQGVTPRALEQWSATWWALMGQPEQAIEALRWCTMALPPAWETARRTTRSSEWLWRQRAAYNQPPSSLWNAWWDLGDAAAGADLLGERRIRWTDSATGWNAGVSWMAAPMEIAVLTGDLTLMTALQQRGVPLFTPMKHTDNASPLLLAIWRAQHTGDRAPLDGLLEQGARWDQGWSFVHKPSTVPLSTWKNTVWSDPVERANAQRKGTPWDLAMSQPGPLRDLASRAFMTMPSAERRRCVASSVYQDSPHWAIVEALVLRASIATVPTAVRSRPRL